MSFSEQERVWEAIKDANLPDPAERPYTVMPVRGGPCQPSCFVEVSAPESRSLLSEVTAEENVEKLSRRIAAMVELVLSGS